MKRPSLALLALLASLAWGLVAIAPRRAEAYALGELLCAIEVVAPPCAAEHDDFCPACPFADELATECPHVCTPPGMPGPSEAHEETPAEVPLETPPSEATAQVELNAADISDVVDSESAWEDEYGYYYGDFKTDEEYASQYASKYEVPIEDEAADQEGDAVATDEAIADGAVPVVVEEDVVEEVEGEESEVESPTYADPYGAYYDPWTPVLSENLHVPSPADLIVDAHDDEAAADEVTENAVKVSTEETAATSAEDEVDMYGRHICDRYYGYDYDETSPADCDYESAYEYEYENDYDYEYDYEYEYESGYEDESPLVEEVTPAETEESTDAAPPEGSADSYYEEYYPDYYAELYGSEESDEAEAADADEAPADSEDLAIEYDAAYDKAIFDEAAELNENLPAPGTAIEVHGDAIIDELVDPTTAEAENDLPWADEAPVAEETATRPALESEYGSDYAEDYYRALFGEEVEPEALDCLEDERSESSTLDNSYDYFAPPYGEEECLTPRRFDATQLVVNYGEEIYALTESLELVSMRLHSACVQLAELPSRVERK